MEEKREKKRGRRGRRGRRRRRRTKVCFFFMESSVFWMFRVIGMIARVFYGDWFVPNLGFWLRDHTNP